MPKQKKSNEGIAEGVAEDGGGATVAEVGEGVTKAEGFDEDGGQESRSGTSTKGQAGHDSHEEGVYN